MHVSDLIQIILLGYLLGSIPFGVVLAKIFRLPDPRYIGSGNIGATNMLRTGRKDIAALTLALDMGKGMAAVMLTAIIFSTNAMQAMCDAPVGVDCPPHYFLNPHYAAFALVAATIGHMFSPWLKFKGGKGVATILGGAIAFSWPLGMAFAVIWLLVLFTTRYVSIASIAALALLPMIAWLRIDGVSALIIALAAAVAIAKHHGNISRLRHGFEPKVSFEKGGTA